VARKLAVGEVFDQVFSIYREHAGVLLPVAFWLYLISAILSGLAGDDLALLSAAGLVSLVVGTLYSGIVVSLVRDVQDGRRDFSLGQLFEFVTPVLGRLLGAGILAALGMFVGFCLLIVPGLYLMTIWAVIAPVIVIERSRVIPAFGRSRELVKGNGWPVFGALLLSLVIIVIGSVIFGLIAEAIADGPLLAIVFSALASTVTAPIAALVAAVLYYRLLAIKPAAADPSAAVPPDPQALPPS
jgi:hypothetical protein